MKSKKLLITRPEQWIVSLDRCKSSETIWAVMMNVEHPNPTIIRDPRDFGRCYGLLCAFPEWRVRLKEVSKKYKEWRGIVKNWSKLEKLLLKHGTDKIDSLSHPELYHLIAKLTNMKLYGVPKKKGSNKVEYKKASPKTRSILRSLF